MSGTLFAGAVKGHEVWIVDDMIESGEALLRAVAACRDRQARAVHLLVVHAHGDAATASRLAGADIDSLTVTETAAGLQASPADPRLRMLSVAPMIGQCMALVHQGKAISPALDPTGSI